MNITICKNVLFLFILMGCTDSHRVVLTPKEIELWQKDSLGCNGFRETIYTQKLSIFKKFIGLNEESLIRELGKFNHRKNKNEESYLYYFLSCGLAPPVLNINTLKSNIRQKQSIYNEEAMILIIRLESNKIVQVNGALS